MSVEIKRRRISCFKAEHDFTISTKIDDILSGTKIICLHVIDHEFDFKRFIEEKEESFEPLDYLDHSDDVSTNEDIFLL